MERQAGRPDGRPVLRLEITFARVAQRGAQWEVQGMYQPETAAGEAGELKQFRTDTAR